MTVSKSSTKADPTLATAGVHWASLTQLIHSRPADTLVKLDELSQWIDGSLQTLTRSQDRFVTRNSTKRDLKR